jgi:microcystin-dependent protein
MSDPYLGEIRIFAGNYAPVDWALCDGQLLQIAQYDALFSLIGTSYGGDGLNTFALPDLRGRLPIHQGGGFVTGGAGGTEQVTLTAQQLAGHSHPLMASTALATQESPAGNVTGQTEIALYGNESPFGPMNGQALPPAGGSQPHDNVQPFLCLTFIICTNGIYPTQG